MEPQDTITIAPSVLITIFKHAALQTTGVARMGIIPVDVVRMLRGNPMGSGVVLELDSNKVNAELYLVVKPGANMRELSHEVQQSATRAVHELVGMDVVNVNIHIDDVEFGSQVSSE
jgi:uncharacterized alkaline shock family protein YloU